MSDISFYFRDKAPMVGFSIMDRSLFVVIAAAFICGSYNNKINIPRSFMVPFAEAVEEYRHVRNGQADGNLNTGEDSSIVAKNIMCILIIMHSFSCFSIT